MDNLEMEKIELSKGDIVVFSTYGERLEGKVIKAYENEYIKVRYWSVFPYTKIVRKSSLHDIKRIKK